MRCCNAVPELLLPQCGRGIRFAKLICLPIDLDALEPLACNILTVNILGDSVGVP